MTTVTEKFRIKVNYQFPKLRDDLVRVIVWHMPKRIIYWAAIRLMSHASTGKYSDSVVPNITIIEALDRWEMD